MALTQAEILSTIKAEYNINVAVYTDYESAFNNWYSMFSAVVSSEYLLYQYLSRNTIMYILNRIKSTSIKVAIGQDEVDKTYVARVLLDALKQINQNIKDGDIASQSKALKISRPIGFDWSLDANL